MLSVRSKRSLRSKVTRDWDNREKRGLLGNPFNLKLIVLLGIIVLAVALVFGFIHQPIYAEAIWEKSYMDRIERIEEKLDWNNCAMLYKEARQYRPPIEHSWDSQSWKDLIDACGEIP